MPKSARKHAAALAVLVSMAAGCATAGPTFGPESATALIVVASPSADRTRHTNFRRVDLPTGTFQGKTIAIAPAGLDGQPVSGDAKPGVWLNVQEVPAGDYAMTGWSIITDEGTTTDCWNEPAPVFILRAGEITVFSPDRKQMSQSSPATTRDALLAEFDAARTKYPNVKGTASVASPHAMIGWNAIELSVLATGKQKGCAGAETFTRRD